MAVLGPRGGIWVPDCRAELAVVHGYAHRLLVFDLPDQLALRITQRASDIRVLGARYERRKARQAGTQYDTLLLAPAVPQRDVHLHISRMPPSQVRPERRQRLQQVWTLLRYETCAYVDDVLAEAISLPTGNFPHRGRSLLQLRVGTHARQVFRCASAPYSELNPITGDQAGIAVTPGESAWPRPTAVSAAIPPLTTQVEAVSTLLAHNAVSTARHVSKLGAGVVTAISAPVADCEAVCADFAAVDMEAMAQAAGRLGHHDHLIRQCHDCASRVF